LTTGFKCKLSKIKTYLQTLATQEFICSDKQNNKEDAVYIHIIYNLQQENANRGFIRGTFFTYVRNRTINYIIATAPPPIRCREAETIEGLNSVNNDPLANS